MIETAEEFLRLRTSEDPEEYRRAALEEATVEVWLDVIAKFPEMKVWVVRNKPVHMEILRFLARDPDPWIRCAVADRRKLSADLFDQLAADPHPEVRESLVGNQKAPLAILELLAKDPNHSVSAAAQEKLKRVGGAEVGRGGKSPGKARC